MGGRAGAVTSIDFFKRIPLFHNLTAAELQNLQSIFQEREYKKNQVIFIEEETGQYMYIVKYEIGRASCRERV
mgnify:CR=1 FL=1